MLQPGYRNFFGSYNVESFVHEKMKIENKLKYYIYNTNFPLNMAKDDDEKHCRATRYWLCNQLFTPLTCVVNKNGKIYGKFRDY